MTGFLDKFQCDAQCIENEAKTIAKCFLCVDFSLKTFFSSESEVKEF